MWITVLVIKEQGNKQEVLFSACCVSLIEVIEALIKGISYGEVKIIVTGDWK